ncbi:MAG: ribonuclease R [Bdellovibrionota bacterium]
MSSINPKDILTLLQDTHGLSFAQICKKLAAEGKQKDQIKKQLKALTKTGQIYRRKDKKFVASQPTDHEEIVMGQIEIHEKGFGFVIREDGQGDDIFIPGKYLNGAAHHERVKVKVISNPTGKKSEGRVIEIITEQNKQWLGVVFSFEQQWFFCPWGQRKSHLISQQDVEHFACQDNDIVLAKLHQGKRQKDSFATLTHKLGHIEDPKIDSEMLIHEYDIEYTFSKAAIAEAQHPTDKDIYLAIRQDLNHLPFVTIDGEDAKDFDDAVYMDTNNHLWVAIADVSQYVHANSKLDIEACGRGNSFYFPDQVVPMLPENLSNFLCSLRPDEEKHAMVVEIAFDKTFQTQLIQITPARITSKARLTYTQVDQMLNGKVPMDDAYKDSLTRLSNLTKQLQTTRQENGAIDFDMPEIRYHGYELKPHKVQRNQAHRLIEECMLAANEVTSKFVDEHGYPNIYRVHEPPDPLKLAEAVESLQQILGVENRWQTPQDAFDIQAIMRDIHDHPFYTQIQYLFLRAMSQARYDTEKLGHFGLGFEYYSHFTSPIRRYADLTLHRLIKRILLKHDLHKPLFPSTYQTLNNVCLHVSKQDRKSLQVERDLKKIKGIRYMQTQTGKIFDGVVSGVLSKGVFIETSPYSIEGLVTEFELKKAGFRYHQQSNQFRGNKKTLSYGSSLQVKVLETNLFKRQLNFSIDV